uniref:Apolipoprotein A-Ib n=1 Tax=Tetraodon nigroviridis TaxID=99883 RepID=H3DA29_TETNG
MKFLALALALLLAVGSQAAPMLADAPSQLQHIRAAADLYLTQAIARIKSALESIDDAELKERVSQRLDDFHGQLKALQGQVSPVTDSVVSTITDATAELRANIEGDIAALKSETEEKVKELSAVVNKHVEEYRSMLEPILSEYQAKHDQEVAALRVKLDPVMVELRKKMETNVEETKAALSPIVEAVRRKIAERVEAVKLTLTPWVEEYKEQFRGAYAQAQSITPEELAALKDKITPLAEDVKTKLNEIFEAVAATLMKQ